jgi:hypothetical protein
LAAARRLLAPPERELDEDVLLRELVLRELGDLARLLEDLARLLEDLARLLPDFARLLPLEDLARLPPDFARPPLEDLLRLEELRELVLRRPLEPPDD